MYVCFVFASFDAAVMEALIRHETTSYTYLVDAHYYSFFVKHSRCRSCT